jgi:hypothetical protein
MREVKLGQQWEIYSPKGRRWHRLVVTHIDGELVTLRSADKQFHECLKSALADSNVYRFVSDAAS